MFQTVRHWWESGRGRITARLFLFEFLVVVAGVLVAQALANGVQRAGQVAQMERSNRLAQSEMASSYGSALVWRQAVSCLNDRLAEVMRLASAGSVPTALVARPRIVQLSQTPISSNDMLILRDVKGPERADLLDLSADNAANFSRHTRALTDDWGPIELVDTQLGAVSSADRFAARAAAADVRAHLRAIEIIGDDIIRMSGKEGINPDFGPKGNGPARSCDAIWKSGRINPPSNMR